MVLADVTAARYSMTRSRSAAHQRRTTDQRPLGVFTQQGQRGTPNRASAFPGTSPTPPCPGSAQSDNEAQTMHRTGHKSSERAVGGVCRPSSRTTRKKAFTVYCYVFHSHALVPWHAPQLVSASPTCARPPWPTPHSSTLLAPLGRSM